MEPNFFEGEDDKQYKEMEYIELFKNYTCDEMKMFLVKLFYRYK